MPANPPLRRIASVIAAVGLFGFTSWAPAQPGAQGSPQRNPAEGETQERPSTRDPRIDPETGADKRIWPPDVLFRHESFLLDMVIADMSKHEFTATATVVISPIAEARSSIVLDAGPGLTFHAVRVGGGPAASFNHYKETQKLTIEFGRSVRVGEKVTIAMDYSAVKPGGRGAALTWSNDDRRTPEVDFMMHAQGQPQSNHLWFPCHDFPNLRVPTELKITVQEPYEAVSNGRLESVQRKSYASIGLAPPEPAKPITSSADDTEARPEPSPTHLRTFHWKQDLPHPYYLVTLVVSRFDVVNIGGPKSEYPGLWMPVYGPLGSEEALKRAFGNTPAMVKHFSELFDYPYVWDKYAQILCRDFAAGAMENTGAVTFQAALVRGGGRRGSIDDIIAHELVHHWFGDLITCRSWEHLWLQEGWATMGEALWAEKQRGQDGYQAAMLRNIQRERTASRNRSSPQRTGMVSNLYRSPDARFTSADNVYSKGGAVLHMLRVRLGDDVFFAGVRDYIRTHEFSQVETDDFRYAMEKASGQSLERFFDQWCKRPGHPSLEIDLAYVRSDSGNELRVTVEQTQKIDGNNPAFAFELPLYLHLSESEGKWVSVIVDTQTTTATFSVPTEPVEVEIDPELTVLCRASVRQPLKAAVRQAEHGRTLALRVRAIEQLAEANDLASLGALLRLAGAGMARSDAFIDDPQRALSNAASDAIALRAQGMLDRARTTVARILNTSDTFARSQP